MEGMGDAVQAMNEVGVLILLAGGFAAVLLLLLLLSQV